ncbi:unnamed protein product [Leuciscus chuanchicus]
MERLGHLPFCKFVCQLHQSSRVESLRSTNFHHTDCSPLPPAVSGSPSPPVTHKRRRKNGSASSSTSTEKRPRRPFQSLVSCPAFSKLPAPPWPSARTPDLSKPAWSVPLAPPWPSARTLALPQPPWLNPPVPPWSLLKTS